MRRMEISRACCPSAGKKPELKALAEKSENEESLRSATRNSDMGGVGVSGVHRSTRGGRGTEPRVHC